MIRRPPRSTRTDTLFPYTTLCRSKDKALEYGKDVWMKFTLPTGHHLYFGIQAKRGKLDAAGKTRNENVAEVLAQIRMMLGHQLFDTEINKRTLVDHAIIVDGGAITKQARTWRSEGRRVGKECVSTVKSRGSP